MSEDKPGGVTAQLIDDLLESGTPVDEGRFTIDGAAAARKMEAFRYGGTTRYLIPLVEALHRLDCRSIDIERKGEDLSLRAANVSLSKVEETLLDLYSHALGEGADNPLGRLAIALDMALSDPNNERIALTYSDAAHSYAAVYRARQGPTLVEGEPEVIRELRVLVDRPWRERLTSSSTIDETLAELSEAVRHSSRPLTLDGSLVSQQPREWSELVEHEGEGFRLRMGFVESTEPSIAELWAADLCLDTIALDGRGLLAQIELDTPKRDLSQMRIIRDTSLEAALALVAEHQPEPVSLVELMKARRAKREEEVDGGDAAAKDEPSEASEPEGRTGSDVAGGLMFWILAMVTGTKAFAIVIGNHEDPFLSVMFSDAFAFMVLGGWVLLASAWTFGISFAGANMLFGERRASLIAAVGSLIVAIAIAVSMPGGM